MKSLVDVDFALVEKHQIKDTINHYNAMCVIMPEKLF